MKSKEDIVIFKVKVKLLFLIVFSSIFLGFPYSFGKNYKLNFGSQNSSLKISLSTKFNDISTNLMFSEGTLLKNSNVQNSGNKIIFVTSILESSGFENLIIGVYYPSMVKHLNYKLLI